MTRIFDNITPNTALGTHLQKTFEVSERMDAAVGYFNLRGWAAFDELVKKKVADDAVGVVVRILIGMVMTGPQEEALPAEEIVRLAPDQYWWVHRRWKDSRSASQKRRAAA